MKKLLALILATAVVISVAACGKTNDSSSVPDVAESTPASSAADASDEIVSYYMQKANEVVVNEDSVTFTDDSGRESITIMKNPEKTTVLFGSLVCLWHEAGGTASAVVGGDTDRTLFEEQIGRDVTLDEGVRVVADSSNGKNWDVEAILADEPDLIVVSVSKRGYETIADSAAAAEIPVIAVQYDSVQDYLKYFKVFCNITGHPELWDEVAEATVEKIADVISEVPDIEAPRTLTIRLNKGDLTAQGNDSQTGSIIKELGGVNAIETDPENGMSGQVEISMENIYALDPDIIFIIQVVSEEYTRNMHEEIVKDDPVWPELRAVKEGRVYYLEKNLFNNKPNKNYKEAYTRMAEYLYPGYEF